MPSLAISAQGTILKRNGTTIAELRDFTPPAMTRNAIETTNHNNSDADFVAGIRRKGDMQFALGWLPSGEATHGASSGLLKAFTDGSKDLYEVDFPDGSKWYFSGFVTSIAPSAPVDDGLTANVTIKPTGAHIFA